MASCAVSDVHCNALSPAAGSIDRNRSSSAPMKYQQETDDGMNQHLWDRADLILVGLSGMSKTPISKHLAGAGVFVANYPLVKNAAVPEALHAMAPQKVVALVIRADVLLGIRQERAYKWGMSTSDPFVDYDEIEDEVRWVKREYRLHPGWKVVNVTDRRPADVASDILAKVLQRAAQS